MIPPKIVRCSQCRMDIGKAQGESLGARHLDATRVMVEHLATSPSCRLNASGTMETA